MNARIIRCWRRTWMLTLCERNRPTSEGKTWQNELLFYFCREMRDGFGKRLSISGFVSHNRGKQCWLTWLDGNKLSLCVPGNGNFVSKSTISRRLTWEKVFQFLVRFLNDHRAMLWKFPGCCWVSRYMASLLILDDENFTPHFRCKNVFKEVRDLSKVLKSNRSATQ